MKTITEFKDKIIKETLNYEDARKLFVKWVNSALDDTNFKEHYNMGLTFLKQHFTQEIANLK